MLDDDHVDDREYHESGDARGQCPIAGNPAAKLLDVDVEHHDDEQEQHHDGADVDEHEHDTEELRIEQQPDQRAVEEAQDQQQRRIDGIAREDHPERRQDQHRRKDKE